MDIVAETKAEFRFRQWTKIIQECQASNLTVTAWCSQHNIGIKSYYYWLRTVSYTHLNIAYQVIIPKYRLDTYLAPNRLPVCTDEFYVI